MYVKSDVRNVSFNVRNAKAEGVRLAAKDVKEQLLAVNGTSGSHLPIQATARLMHRIKGSWLLNLRKTALDLLTGTFTCEPRHTTALWSGAPRIGSGT